VISKLKQCDCTFRRPAATKLNNPG